MERKRNLLQIPAGYRCEAARHFAYHAGRAYQERIGTLRKLCIRVVDAEDLYKDQECLLYLLPENIKRGL
eukprot:8226316-Alexandrium_andersonii.AAC.1